MTDDRVQIETGVCGDAQESSFMNATLQQAGNQDRIEFSIATYVTVPAEALTDEDSVADFLEYLLDSICRNHMDISFHVQVGPYGDAEDYIE